MREVNSENCKYYSFENGCKNGKACLIDPNQPRKCLRWYYAGYPCEDFEMKENDNRGKQNI